MYFCMYFTVPWMFHKQTTSTQIKKKTKTPNDEQMLKWSIFAIKDFFTYITFFFFCIPSFISGVHHFGSGFFFCVCDHFWNHSIEVVTFHLGGGCILDVFLLPSFTRLRHKRQDLLSLCDGMLEWRKVVVKSTVAPRLRDRQEDGIHVCTD